MMLFLLMLVLWTDIAFGNNLDFADVELTTIVKSKTKECFYQFAESRYIMRFEFQVIDAGISSKDLTVSVVVRSPSRAILLKALKKTSKIKRIKLYETGDYEICLDNTYSLLSSKTVYFEISVEANPEQLQPEDFDNLIDNDTNDTLSLLKRTNKVLKRNLEKIKHYQDTYRAVEARDINIQEKNLVKVNTFSSLTAVCMILFGCLHLFILKSMFNRKSFIYKVLKILCS